jgi:hypothetical protein
MSLAKARVLMICDDHQIDRRITQEATTLIRNGYEVIVIGRAGSGYPAAEIVDGVKIERIDANSFQTRAPAARTVAAFAALLEKEPEKPASSRVSWLLRNAALPAKLSFSNYGPYWLDDWIHRQGWLVRNAMKALLWPPYRLHALHYYLPSVSVAVRYAIYLPTLLLTPRPRAILWHWARARLRLQSWYEIEARISRLEDFNQWEMAVLERGRFYRPDIVHVHDLPQLRPGVFLAEELGVPVIYDAHELFTDYTSHGPQRRRELKVTERHFIRKASHVIGVNPFPQSGACE